eukprot:514492_1
MLTTQHPTSTPPTMANKPDKRTKIAPCVLVVIIIIVVWQLHAIGDSNDSDPHGIQDPIEHILNDSHPQIPHGIQDPIGQISIDIADLLDEPIVLKANQHYFLPQRIRRTTINVHLQENYLSPLADKQQLNITLNIQNILHVLETRYVDGAFTRTNSGNSNGSQTFHVYTQTKQTTSST